MTTPAPMQLPLTREQFLERYGRSRWGERPEYDFEKEMDGHDLVAFEAVLAAAGLPLAYAEPAPAPPPEPRWPAKLEAVGGRTAARLIEPGEEEFAWVVISCSDNRAIEVQRAAELARRWSRCAELEREVPGAFATLKLQKESIDALLASLAERTRERDEARRRAEFDRSCLDELRAERDSARQEAAELRRRWRRCEWAATVAQRRADLSSHGMDDLLPKVLRGEVTAFDKEPSDA